MVSAQLNIRSSRPFIQSGVGHFHVDLLLNYRPLYSFNRLLGVEDFFKGLFQKSLNFKLLLVSLLVITILYTARQSESCEYQLSEVLNVTRSGIELRVRFGGEKFYANTDEFYLKKFIFQTFFSSCKFA